MVFVPAKMYQISVERKGRDSIADFLFRLGRSLPDGLANFLQYFLSGFWEGVDVGVNSTNKGFYKLLRVRKEVVPKFIKQ